MGVHCIVCVVGRETKWSCLSFNDAPRVIQKFSIRRAQHSMRAVFRGSIKELMVI